jgi:methionine--tRNA ligase beta chain
MITIEELKKLDVRIGKILSAQRIENTDKLIKLEVDLGDEKRQIVTGIAEYFEPKDLEGKQIPIAVNLEPKTFKGVESQGMILAASVEGRPVLLLPEEEVPPGSRVI